MTATAAMTSAEASFGSQWAFWSSVPPANRARVRISGRVINEPPAPSDAFDSSSVATTIPMYSLSPPSLNPSYSTGTLRPKPPISARPWMRSSGMSSLCRWMCSATGTIFSVAKRRNVSCTISKSASRWRGPGVSASAARNSGDRYVATNDRVASSTSGSTPQSASRPNSFGASSATASAT